MTKEELKKLIADCWDEAMTATIESEPLLAEPVGDEDPPLIESQSRHTRFIQILKRLSESERVRIFSAFGFYKAEAIRANLLRFQNQSAKASKGDL